MKKYLHLFLVGVFMMSTALPLLTQAASGIVFPTDTGLPDALVGDILSTLMSWLLAIFGMLAIIAFVITGMQYLASAGDPKLAESAKKNMVSSIIGIVVALSGLVILQAISTLLDAPTNNSF